MTAVTKEYANTREASNDIARLSELAEQLKALYFHYETADHKVISKIENDFSNTKMDIIEWLDEPSNYNLFKSSPDAKQALFFKQVKEGFYNHEIGLNQELKDQIYRDFLQKYNSTPAEELMTAQEKRNIQILQQEHDLEGNKPNGLAQANFLLNIYNKTRCFDKNWDYVKNNLPRDNLLDKDAVNLLKTIKSSPHFLKDNPNHFLKNKGDYKNQAPDLKDIYEAAHSSSLGSPEGKEKIKKYEKLFKDFTEKKPEKQEIFSVRDKAVQKNTTGITPNKSTPF